MSIANPQRKIQILACIVGILLIVPLCVEMITGFIAGYNLDIDIDKNSYPVGFEIIPTEEQTTLLQSNVGAIEFMDFNRSGLLYLTEGVISPILTIITTLISFAAVICAIYYIICVIKLVPIIARDGFMNAPAIKQLRRVSYSMLLSYMLFSLASFLPTWYYNMQLELTNYTFSYPLLSDSFVTAIVLILLTEILRIALRLKEEQELTI